MVDLGLNSFGELDRNNEFSSKIFFMCDFINYAIYPKIIV